MNLFQICQFQYIFPLFIIQICSINIMLYLFQSNDNTQSYLIPDFWTRTRKNGHSYKFWKFVDYEANILRSNTWFMMKLFKLECFIRFVSQSFSPIKNNYICLRKFIICPYSISAFNFQKNISVIINRSSICRNSITSRLYIFESNLNTW